METMNKLMLLLVGGHQTQKLYWNTTEKQNNMKRIQQKLMLVSQNGDFYFLHIQTWILAKKFNT